MTVYKYHILVLLFWWWRSRNTSASASSVLIFDENSQFAFAGGMWFWRNLFVQLIGNIVKVDVIKL